MRTLAGQQCPAIEMRWEGSADRNQRRAATSVSAIAMMGPSVTASRQARKTRASMVTLGSEHGPLDARAATGKGNRRVVPSSPPDNPDDGTGWVMGLRYGSHAGCRRTM
jgi:hypothetical protein